MTQNISISPTLALQQITMSQTQNYDGTTVNAFIYENGPENIDETWFDTAAYGRAFTYVQLIPGYIYEAEFYNWNWTNTKSVRLGIGIKNTSTTSAQVTILKKAISKTDKLNPKPSNIIGSDMTVKFMKDTQSTPLSIPANSGATQGFKDLLSETIVRSELVNGRIRFRVDSGTSLYAKIYFVDSTKTDWEKFAGWTNLISQADLNRPDSQKPQTYLSETSYTGVYQNVNRAFTVPNLNPVEIALGQKLNNKIVDLYNINEFETPSNTLPFVVNGNQGNYGIVYTPYCSVPNAKYFKLTPKKIATIQRYVIKENGFWKIVDASQTSPYKGTLTGGTSFWFVLAGGNHGDVEIQFSTTPF
ncbi:hypothetical protein [Brevibacillus sp. NRS-1366]|uniref:hypothetical protein n=1 Tax=Brevibacillus sp. NRS-1366 TaxID=3233899 RepID=UPI003D22341E